MTYDDATAADAIALAGLINAAYRPDDAAAGWSNESGLLAGARIDAAGIAALLVAGRFIVAREEPAAAPAACVHIADGGDGCWLVGLLAVDPASQAAGRGRAMLVEVARRARITSIARLRLTVVAQRLALIAWYERCGFVRTGETIAFPYDDPRVGRPLRDDLTLVALEKSL